MEVIQALIELQSVDDEIREHRVQRDDLSTNLNTLEKILAGMSSELEEKREKLAEADRFYTDQQEELKADGERMSKTKQKLAAVTRTKEYAAVQRELDNVRKKYSEDEAELKRLGEAMEEYNTSIAAAETKLAELQSEVSREEAANVDRLGHLSGQISAVDGRRGAILDRVEDRIVRRYERVLAGREGRAVVPAQNGKCTGCQMKLPPQLFILVQRLETLESCPACQRFLFFKAPEAEA